MDKTRDMAAILINQEILDISQRSVHLSEQKDDQRASFALHSFQFDSGY